MSGCTFVRNHQTGETTFKVAGLTHTVTLPTTADTLILARMFDAADAAGVARGQRALAQLVAGTLEPYRER